MSKSPISIVVGLQYGDEGKARVVDQLAADHDFVVRFNGGANAGHTIKFKEKVYALKQVPSGILSANTKLYIGSGCAVNLVKLAKEIKSIEADGIEVRNRLKISGNASMVQPHHILLDQKQGGKVGTTGNGIGPLYSDQAMRTWNGRLVNIQLAELAFNTEETFQIIEQNLREICKRDGLDPELGLNELEKIKESLEFLRENISDNPLEIEQYAGDKKILCEGAQALMLDKVHGLVPYVTSSHTIPAAAFTGGDLSTKTAHRTIGVAKVIMSRVGHGPFVSEFGGEKSEVYCMKKNEDGSPKFGRAVENEYPLEELLKSEDLFEMSKAIRVISGEYGVVTARPRRVGALDLVQLKTLIKAHGINELFLTKCDLLNVFSKTKLKGIPLVTAYNFEGKKLDYQPVSTSKLKKVEAEYTYLENFSEDVSNARKPEELPQQLLEFVKFVENFTECKVRGIGVGPGREQYVSFSE